jgi:hypothetical protein
VENVVDTLKSACALDRVDAGRFLDYADDALVAGRAGAVGAGIDVGDVVADGAEAQTCLEPAHGFSEGRSIVVGGAQDMEGEALGTLCADAWELLQFFNEPGHGLGIA